ncbi:capsular polysaccharide biosynthesis protein [Ramlibacter sp.]|uniref:capsular polysaccharide biosynthesis protein n=1 Tax=Ramlibacter sp. TaxID=1917967 RepID=UPI002FCAADF2
MSLRPDARLGTTSAGILKLTTLPELLEHRLEPAVWRFWRAPSRHEGDLTGIVGWGCRPTTHRARRVAVERSLPYVALEDGFLRSLGTGALYPPLSIVVDELGIYYDSSRPSALEKLLNSATDLLEGRLVEVQRARELVLAHGLSKYNHAPRLEDSAAQALVRDEDVQRVLVVDQTAGDMSVALGRASARTFTAMLEAALAENPAATVYVKTHPEVTSGRKAGYFQKVQSGGRVVVLREAVEPLSLLSRMNRVYVVSSTMGFEALLAGKPVTCFGLPWYAGWGVTDDRQSCPQRTRRRTVAELFAAAYFDYTRYLDPVTGRRGTIFDVIEWLARQKQMAQSMRGPHGPRRLICIGFRRWKAANLRPILAGALADVLFVPDVEAARGQQPRPGDWLVFWGAVPPTGCVELAQACWAEVVRVEDGFVRSVGLGSDLIAPRSLVLDRTGIYFDPSRPSSLEHLLNTAGFSAQELDEARAVREFIVANGLTKYNLGPRRAPHWNTSGKRVVLVPGQVEDDASIRLGCAGVRTNAGLLKATRAACPGAFIVYKPHPDVASGNRRGRLALEKALRWADYVETQVSVVSCVEVCDEVHTMTSLTGFDALLRGKKVVVYGQPFYAGWGLTHDVLGPEQGTAFARRRRQLALDELVAGTLLKYPIYWDPKLKGYTTCMAVLRQLAAERDALEGSGRLERLRTGWWRRQARKVRILLEVWTR